MLYRAGLHSGQCWFVNHGQARCRELRFHVFDRPVQRTSRLTLLTQPGGAAWSAVR